MLRLMLSGLIHRIKGTFMNDLIEKQLYLGIVAVLKDDNLYHESSVGKKVSTIIFVKKVQRHC